MVKKGNVLIEINKSKYLLMLAAPTVLYYLVFHYFPLYGIIIAFKDFTPGLGIWGSTWVGFEHFVRFFDSVYFWRLISNTLIISIYTIIFGFPIPIIFALLLNEMKSEKYKRVVQTISYMPHFISLVVVVGIMVNFLSLNDGIVNVMLTKFGMTQVSFMTESSWFRFLYVASEIWQQFGWNSIIYLAAMSSIDPTYYEAATIDGASRFDKMMKITLPSIMPTIVMLLIMRMGGLMSVGFAKIILMYSPATYDVADVISTYTYRTGIVGGNFSFGSAIGLFNAVINFIMLVGVNKLSRKINDIGIW